MSALLAALSPYLIVGSLCLLAGAALGYYTAAADEAREVAAEIEDADSVITRYDNPTSARADFLALTGVEA